MWKVPENISENYKNAVKEALNNNDAFKTFKSNENYIAVVGMSNPTQSISFLGRIKEYPNIFSKINELSLNDSIGNPFIIPIDGLNISPNTLRYIKTLCDLYSAFGDLNGKSVCELGIGYGGLAFIISKFFKNIKSYHLVDLADVENFALKYLSALDITTATSNRCSNSDVFISEFCLSEFDDEQLYEYYDLYIKNSKGVYLTMNLHQENRKQKFIEHISKDFSIIVMDEYPKTMWPNYIIVGRKS